MHLKYTRTHIKESLFWYRQQASILVDRKESGAWSQNQNIYDCEKHHNKIVIIKIAPKDTHWIIVFNFDEQEYVSFRYNFVMNEKMKYLSILQDLIVIKFQIEEA